MLPMRGVIIDVDHDPSNREETVMRLFLRTENGWTVVKEKYHPYFYVLTDDLEKFERILRAKEGVVSVERTRRKVRWEEKEVLMMRVTHPKYIPKLKEDIEENGAECREHDIPTERKYLYEKGIVPMSVVEFEEEGGWLKSVKTANGEIPIRVAALDLEMYARDRMPDPQRDEIIMASYVDSDGTKVVITTKEIDLPFVKRVETESQLISELNRVISERDPDIILTYNGDMFDLPYLKERAHALGLRIPWGRDGSEPKIRRAGGGTTSVDITGRAHVDVFQIVQFMAGVGAINTFKLDLENVYKTVLGREKVKIDHRDIASEWSGGDLEKLALYN
ncbi:MAG: polymerase, archaea type, partial [Candidatus Diapherotrites archaeon]|nr:polymerase, archaea type [Candidatus Diapherotrites archaeon]